MSNKDFENGLALGLSVGTGYKGDNFPDNYVKWNKYCSSQIDTLFTDALPEEFTVDFSDKPPTYLRRAFYHNGYMSTPKKITIIGDLSKVTSYEEIFGCRGNLTEVVANIDFSSVTATRATGINVMTSSLKKLTFVPNTLKVSMSLYNFAALVDATIVSLANCLNSTANNQTLTLHATPKARCATLMGNVNSDGLFVADENGTISLETFITSPSYKNWTLA